jgi:hypothetical protein
MSTTLIAREQAKRAFLVKQRELAVGKGFHQFKRSPNLDKDMVNSFFVKCEEMSILQVGDKVSLSMKKTPSR